MVSKLSNCCQRCQILDHWYYCILFQILGKQFIYFISVFQASFEISNIQSFMKYLPSLHGFEGNVTHIHSPRSEFFENVERSKFTFLPVLQRGSLNLQKM